MKELNIYLHSFSTEMLIGKNFYIFIIIQFIIVSIAFFWVRKYRLKLSGEDLKRFNRKSSVAAMVLIGLGMIAYLIAFYISPTKHVSPQIFLLIIILIFAIDRYKINRKS